MDKEVRINFKSSADNSGAKSASKELENLKKSIENVSAADIDLDLDRALESIDLLDQGFQNLKEASEEGLISPEDLEILEEKTEEIKEQFQQLADEIQQIPEELRDVSKEAKKSNDSLKGAAKSGNDLADIKKLQIVDALKSTFEQSREAGNALSEFGSILEKNDKTTGDYLQTVDLGAKSVTSFAVATKSAYLALGPLGVALAVATTAISFFAKKYSEASSEIEDGSRKQIAAIRAAADAAEVIRDRQKSVEQSIRLTSNTIKNQIDLWDRKSRNIDKATESLRENQAAQDALLSAELELEVAQVEARTDINDLEKLRLTTTLRQNAELQKQQNFIEGLEKQKEINNQKIENKRVEVSGLDKEGAKASKLDSEADELDEEIARKKTSLKESKALNSSTIAGLSNSTGIDRGENETDRSFLERIQFKEGDDGGVGRALSLLDGQEAIQENIDETIDKRDQKRADANTIRSNIGGKREAADRELFDTIAANKKIEEDIIFEEKLNKIKNKRASIVNNTAIRTKEDSVNLQNSKNIESERSNIDKGFASVANQTVSEVGGLFDPQFTSQLKTASAKLQDGAQGKEADDFLKILNTIVDALKSQDGRETERIVKLQNLQNEVNTLSRKHKTLESQAKNSLRR